MCVRARWEWSCSFAWFHLISFDVIVLISLLNGNCRTIAHDLLKCETPVVVVAGFFLFLRSVFVYPFSLELFCANQTTIAVLTTISMQWVELFGIFQRDSAFGCAIKMYEIVCHTYSCFSASVPAGGLVFVSLSVFRSLKIDDRELSLLCVAGCSAEIRRNISSLLTLKLFKMPAEYESFIFNTVLITWSLPKRSDDDVDHIDTMLS